MPGGGARSRQACARRKVGERKHRENRHPGLLPFSQSPSWIYETGVDVRPFRVGLRGWLDGEIDQDGGMGRSIMGTKDGRSAGSIDLPNHLQPCKTGHAGDLPAAERASIGRSTPTPFQLFRTAMQGSRVENPSGISITQTNSRKTFQRRGRIPKCKDRDAHG
jgi:hypothetical protein